MMKMKTKTVTNSRYYHRFRRPTAAANRDYYQRMGSVIQAIETSQKPMTSWRLTYSARLTWRTLVVILDEMIDYGLVTFVDAKSVYRKRGPRRYGEVGIADNVSVKFVQATAKGRKFLTLTQKMATLMPTAPWLVDQE